MDPLLKQCVNCAVKGLNCDMTRPLCASCVTCGSHSCTYDLDLTNPQLYDVFPPSANFNGRILPFSFDSRMGGQFGAVRRGDLKDGGNVAVKNIFRPRRMPSTATLQSLQEAWKWSQLQHPNIVPFLGVVNSRNLRPFGAPQICLVSKWMPEGDIMQYIAGHASKNRLPLLLDAVRGLCYLHSQSPIIIHGGLRGSNLIIELGPSGEPKALIRDFGHQRAVQIFSDEYEIDSTIVPDLGNPRWIAFERLSPWMYQLKSSRDGETVASDVFELLRTFLEVLSGRPPFYHMKLDAFIEDMVRHKWLTPDRPTEPCSDLDQGMWELMQRAWSREIDKRPGLEEIRAFLEDAIHSPHNTDNEWVSVSTIPVGHALAMSVVHNSYVEKGRETVDEPHSGSIVALVGKATKRSGADGTGNDVFMGNTHRTEGTDPAPVIDNQRARDSEVAKVTVTSSDDWFIATWNVIRGWIWGA